MLALALALLSSGFLPFFGLLSSAAWEHEPGTCAVILDPQDEGVQEGSSR